MSLTKRTASLAVAHAVFFSLIYYLAFALRYDFAIPAPAMDILWLSVVWVCGQKLALFYLLSNYHGWWRFVTFADLRGLLQGSILSLLVIASTDHFFANDYQIPRSVLLIDCVLTIVTLGGLRCTGRLLQETYRPFQFGSGFRNAIIVGADVSSGLVAQQIRTDPRLKYRIVGFLDADPVKRGSVLGGIEVLGGLEDIAQFATAKNVADIFVIDSSIPGSQLRQVMEECERSDLKLKIIPAMDQLLNGRKQIPLRDIDINDLLRREPVELDGPIIEELIRSRSVMVTGAGGSIGSEICRQILSFHPKSLVLVERFENNLFLIERELQRNSRADSVSLHPCIADVTDAPRMRQIFEDHRIDVVFHAAAHKHVPILEFNPGEAVKNNVLGTKCVADLASRYEAAAFVLISTDKAVNPASVMGITKQLAERYIYSLSQKSKTRFVAVRFGNVLGSAGSVIPIFQEQIRRGGPITITHREMERYFMTIPEASQLVLQAAAIGLGGETFVLDMGEPVRITDLALDLLRLSGVNPDEIEIIFTGLRPGEKLYEELHLDGETLLPAAHPKIGIVDHRSHSPT